MDILNPKVSYQRFFAQLSESSTSLLMLDYDGTLSPFTTDRDNARPYERVVPLIKEIVEYRHTRVVIISGRSVEVLRQLIGDEINCELWGSHGAERFANQKITLALKDQSSVKEGLAAIDNWAGENDLGKYLERKSFGRAFHWRGEPGDVTKRIASAIEHYWPGQIEKYGLSVHRFNGGIELRPADISKANAVETILSEIAPDTPLAYLGDDQTDEDAFEAIADNGLKVLVRNDSRHTAADLRLQPPDELVAFLEDWLRAVSN